MQIPSHSIYKLLNLHASNLELMDIVIQKDSPALNKTISSINLPSETSILIVVRDGKVLVPNGDMLLTTLDEILLIGPKQSEIAVKKRLMSSDALAE
jgi:trk system potassium uptake protein TrkA